MKAILYTLNGEKKGTIELAGIFSTPVREEIAGKYFEANKYKHPFSPKPGAGMRQQGQGQISHKRHDWKGQYGRGISRVPRKTMSRHGTQFNWIASNMPGVRGGRKAHPPKGIGREKKINQKEIKIALNSGFAATTNQVYLKKRYETFHEMENVPFILESIPQKTKPLVTLLRKLLGENISIALKEKSIRPGKGKLRNRKYKSNAGILVVVSSEEKARLKGFDIKNTKDVKISDLYPLGRLTIYTEKAVHELNSKESKK